MCLDEKGLPPIHAVAEAGTAQPIAPPAMMDEGDLAAAAAEAVAPAMIEDEDREKDKDGMGTVTTPPPPQAEGLPCIQEGEKENTTTFLYAL